MSLRKLQFWLVTLVFLISVSTVMAQVRPAMNVYVNWSPDQSLTSVGGDEHFVDAQFYVDGNVQFWAAEIQCNFGNGSQLSFQSVADLTFSDPWTATGDFVETGTADFTQGAGTAARYYNPANGLFGFTASRVGVDSLPMGINGRDYTLLLATARFKVNDLPANASVATVCRVANFLDRDGKLLVRGRQTRLNNLQIFVGYTLEGTALRQGTNNHLNIRVTCTFDPLGVATPIYETFTNSRGAFKFGGATQSIQPNVLRDYGLYRCNFESFLDGTNEDGAVAMGQTYFNLSSPSMALLPVVLKAGNFLVGLNIDISDIAVVTGNYNNIGLPLLTGGDANADGRVNAADLAIVTGNDGTSDPNDADHMIFSMGRDFDDRQIFPNSKIWWGIPSSGQVYELVSRSRTRDFWATLSPDGKEIAYVAVDARSGQHVLAFGTVANGRGVGVRVPRGYTDHMLAPSWSPDGNRLAFICTPDNVAGNSGMQYNEGDICIVNRDDRTLATLYSLDVDARIFPPTWMPYGADDHSYVLLYGGTDDLVHFYDLTNSTQGIVNIDNGGSDVIDMPVFQRNINTGANTLVYRFNAGASSDPYLKLGTLNYDGVSFSGGVLFAVNGSTHIALNAGADTTGVDYFDVSPQVDIAFYYSYNYIIANPSFGSALNAYLTIDAPGYAGIDIHYPDGFIGNPVTETLNGGIWNGSYNVATMLHAQRMTFDWVP